MLFHTHFAAVLPLSSGGSSPLAFLPLAIPVVVIAITLKVFWPTIKSALHSRKLLQTGKTAQARILAVRQTGVYVNKQPQLLMTLDVNPEFGASFQSEARKVVALVQLASFQPGGMVEVKYDPADTKEVAISALLSNGTLGAAGSVPASVPSMNPKEIEEMLMNHQAVHMQIIQSGVQTTARILQYMPMNINVNGNNPVVSLMVEVQPSDGSPFAATVQGLPILEASIPKFQPGQIVTVRYMPGDHTRVALEHSGT